VTVGALLDRLRRPGVRALATLLLAGLFARAVVAAAIFPAPLSLPVLVWPQAALHREPNAPLPARGEELLPQLLPDKLPPGPGTRILAENPYAYAALFGSGYDVVPVWSPEVAFLFDPGVSAPQAHQRLWALGIRAVIYNPLSLNTDYERRAAPFFKDGPAGWKPLCELKDTSTIVYELLPPE